MQYFKSTKEYKYAAQNVSKVHILKDEKTWLCGLSRKPNFVQVDDIKGLSICHNCEIAAGFAEKERQETFKGFIVRHVTQMTEGTDPQEIHSALEKACQHIQAVLEKYSAKTYLEIEKDFVDEMVGHIVIEANGMKFNLRFTYKRNRKNKLHFESASRHYLTLPIDYVLNPDMKSGALF